jgi:ATP-binding cassette subfamily B protein
MRPVIPSLQPLRLVLPHLWPSERNDLKARVAVSGVCMLLAAAVTAISPLLLATLTDRLASTPTSHAVAGSLGLIALYAISRILMQVLTQVRDLVFAKVVFHAMSEVAVDSLAHLQSLSLAFHLERKTGEISRVVERGTVAVGTLLSYALFNTVPVLLLLVFFAVEMAWSLGIGIAATALLTVTVYAWFTIAFTAGHSDARRQVNESDLDVAAKTVDGLLNYETIKHFNVELHEQQRLRRSFTRFAESSIRAVRWLSLLSSGQAIIVAIGIAAVMSLTAIGVHRGTLTVGGFIMANAILLQLYQPLSLLGIVYREIMQGLTDTEALAKLLDQPVHVRDSPAAAELHVSRGEIRFREVEFGYEPARPILQAVSFIVPPGKTVAIVGASGAGKSTIGRLLCRFYDVTAGSIAIDGRDIRTVTQASLRAAIAVVPQDTMLFNDTIEYNIRIGRLNAEPCDIERAARSAQIEAFIARLPEGYQSLVGERGLKLSGGEKQRIAIARAVLKDSPIILLDEATSSLDSATEKAIQAAIGELSRNRTTLVIAHRLSTIVDADQILVLDRGRVVERGTHRVLLAADGHYARLWRRQATQSAEAGAPDAVASPAEHCGETKTWSSN